MKFAKSYCGGHDNVYAGLTDADTGEAAVPASRGQSPSAPDDLVVARFNDVEMIERILADAVERDVAAVLIGPVMSNAGVESPAPDFLRTLRSRCDRHGVVLVYDEVIAGFRIARGGAAGRTRSTR
ncbi:aminotransferase class III-fold pyridoxal phosphate-dependent enzyme [Streptomyces sp. NPDC097704]|uniref:aminotransferase class III-fold pyridoxal phosphate-dependent enzyme n=1 Tax=Streptomyces sp. NPDC097704 TaxID=3157101 RepID=UPI00332AFF5D